MKLSNPSPQKQTETILCKMMQLYQEILNSANYTMPVEILLVKDSSTEADLAIETLNEGNILNFTRFLFTR